MNTLQSFDEITAETPVETPEEKQARENRLEIADLKSKLAATDYIGIKIGEGAATEAEYADKLAEREAWRARINELEGILK